MIPFYILCDVGHKKLENCNLLFLFYRGVYMFKWINTLNKNNNRDLDKDGGVLRIIDSDGGFIIIVND